MGKDGRLPTLEPRVPVLDTQRAPTLVPGSWRGDKQGANARGYTYRWQKAREQFLRLHPLCQCKDCDEGRIRVRPATVVDHRKAHRGDPALFWDPKNWQAMAKQCHDEKTAREGEGGSESYQG